MNTRKLDKWADLLLDTGKRNNLINFKDTRTSTVEILFPSSDALFKKIDGLASFEVFDPKIIENNPEYEQNQIETRKLPFCPNTLENSNGRIRFCFIMQQQIHLQH